MKIEALAVAAGLSAPLILIGSAAGGFLGLSCDVGGTEDIMVVRVWAKFDRPGQDLFLTAAGTPASPMDIHVTGGGTFFQHPFGDFNGKAPSAALVAVFPSLAFDSFVTIGVSKLGPPDGQPVDALQFTPGWPGFGPGPLQGNNLGWGVTPNDAQADPFNPNFVFGNGDVLIGQFSTTDGWYVSVAMKILVRSNGVTTQLSVFTACGCLDKCKDCNPSPSPDCNGNGQLDSCDIEKGKSPDANSNGVPDECELSCLDCAGGDLEVDIVDLLALLGQWGQTGTACDFGGNGVDLLDFLFLLASWGPCP